jgi:hypothetical protein
MERIIHIEVDGKTRLGFDTGLNAQGFAQARLALLINRTGVIVLPDGTTTLWRAEGAVEHHAAGSPARNPEVSMVIWGPDFTGNRLDRLIEDTDQDALDALRYWVQACKVLYYSGWAADNRDGDFCSWPAAAMLADGRAGSSGSGIPGDFPGGTVFFPPARLVRRAVEAEDSGAWLKGVERWTHPDLSGEAAAVFTAGAMLYGILCDEPPFSNNDIEGLHSDIREEVYVPPALMAPGLDRSIAGLITGALVSAKTGRPSLEEFGAALGPPLSGGREVFFHRLSREEGAKLEAEREKFKRKKTARVKTGRFIRRNTTIIGGITIALSVLGLGIGSVVKGRADLPTTNGMSPQEVITTYYGAFETLDHTLMEACTLDKAGKSDVALVTNMFMISKIREAYEMSRRVIPAREWLDSGAAPTELTVVGVTDLRLETEEDDERDGEVRYRADYTLWFPAANGQDGREGAGEPADTSAAAPVLPTGTAVTDEIRLILRKGAWRIADIQRETR